MVPTVVTHTSEICRQITRIQEGKAAWRMATREISGRMRVGVTSLQSEPAGSTEFFPKHEVELSLKANLERNFNFFAPRILLIIAYLALFYYHVQVLITNHNMIKVRGSNPSSELANLLIVVLFDYPLSIYFLGGSLI